MSARFRPEVRATRARLTQPLPTLGRVPARRSRSEVRGAIGLACALTALACGDDDEARPPAPPPGPPVLTIERIRSAGRAVWSPGDEPCIAPGLDAAGTIVIEIGERAANQEALRNWTLRTFEGCGNIPQCGLVLVTLADAETGKVVHQVAHTRVAIPIEFVKLGLPETSYDLRVELVDDEGFPFRLEGGVAVSELSDLVISSECAPAPGDAGVDASIPDAAGPDGAPSPVQDAGLDATVVDGSVDAAPSTDAAREASVTDDASLTDGGASPEAGPRDASADAPADG